MIVSGWSDLLSSSMYSWIIWSSFSDFLPEAILSLSPFCSLAWLETGDSRKLLSLSSLKMGLPWGPHSRVGFWNCSTFCSTCSPSSSSSQKWSLKALTLVAFPSGLFRLMAHLGVLLEGSRVCTRLRCGLRRRLRFSFSFSRRWCRKRLFAWVVQ